MGCRFLENLRQPLPPPPSSNLEHGEGSPPPGFRGLGFEVYPRSPQDGDAEEEAQAVHG